jgi:hypothetical protein
VLHVTPSVNRDSIAEHGLDWCRMSTTGIAAVPVSGRAGSPEEEGIFLCESLDDVEFFVSFGGHPLVDVWQWTPTICRSSLVPTGGSSAADRSKLVGCSSFSATDRRSRASAPKSAGDQLALQSVNTARTPGVWTRHVSTRDAKQRAPRSGAPCMEKSTPAGRGWTKADGHPAPSPCGCASPQAPSAGLVSPLGLGGNDIVGGGG